MSLRRLLRRPPTVQQCIRATFAESGSACRPQGNARPSVPDTAPVRPVELSPAPRYSDPFAGVVTGPLLVERIRWIRAWHENRYGDHRGFPEIEWGPFNEGDV